MAALSAEFDAGLGEGRVAATPVGQPMGEAEEEGGGQVAQSDSAPGGLVILDGKMGRVWFKPLL
ncbi:hypothetical protein [Belnapia rosea]|uniref:hypothetical protein n=1 Tax=Belnapia rosea TaxID=938405 RepID=UPI00115FFC66|nr:hypothetical protein [Belnapia rosea]